MKTKIRIIKTEKTKGANTIDYSMKTKKKQKSFVLLVPGERKGKTGEGRKEIIKERWENNEDWKGKEEGIEKNR